MTIEIPSWFNDSHGAEFLVRVTGLSNLGVYGDGLGVVFFENGQRREATTEEAALVQLAIDQARPFGLRPDKLKLVADGIDVLTVIVTSSEANLVVVVNAVATPLTLVDGVETLEITAPPGCQAVVIRADDQSVFGYREVVVPCLQK